MSLGNHVTFIGRLTADPELKKTANDKSYCNFSLARNRRVQKDADPVTDFINFVAWGNTADMLCKYFHKGERVGVSGELQQRSWEDNNGNKRYVVEVIARELEFIERKTNNNDTDATSKANYVTQQPNTINIEEYEEVESSDDLPF